MYKSRKYNSFKSLKENYSLNIFPTLLSLCSIRQAPNSTLCMFLTQNHTKIPGISRNELNPHFPGLSMSLNIQKKTSRTFQQVWEPYVKYPYSDCCRFGFTCRVYSHSNITSGRTSYGPAPTRHSEICRRVRFVVVIEVDQCNSTRLWWWWT